jgi:APA family basic amino acid/polyamine antiporter
MGLFTKKPMHLLMQEAGDSEKGMKRTLTAGSLVALGIGAIIGAGLFVRTAAAAAQNAGPSVTIGFIVAAIGCALAGLCYAELSSSIPISWDMSPRPLVTYTGNSHLPEQAST